MTIKQPREKFVTIDYSNGPDNVNGGEYCVT